MWFRNTNVQLRTYTRILLQLNLNLQIITMYVQHYLQKSQFMIKSRQNSGQVLLTTHKTA